LRSTTPVGKELGDQIEAGELVTNPRPKLLTRQKDEAGGRLEKDEPRPLGQAGALSHVSRDDDAAAISHHDCVCPTHATMVPPAV
jgi:hypothetical protein